MAGIKENTTPYMILLTDWSVCTCGEPDTVNTFINCSSYVDTLIIQSVSGYWFPVAGFGLPVSDSGFPVSDSGFPGSGFGLPGSGYWLPVAGFKLPVSDFWFPASGIHRMTPNLCSSSFALSGRMGACPDQLPYPLLSDTDHVEQWPS